MLTGPPIRVAVGPESVYGSGRCYAVDHGVTQRAARDALRRRFSGAGPSGIDLLQGGPDDVLAALPGTERVGSAT